MPHPPEGPCHWADGGETTMDNLVLLCRHHHRLVHEGGFGVQMQPNGTTKFTDPTSRPLPQAPETRFSGNVFAMRRQNQQSGLKIDPETTVPHWEGEKMDDGMAVEGLLWLNRHGQSDGNSDFESAV